MHGLLRMLHGVGLHAADGARAEACFARLAQRRLSGNGLRGAVTTAAGVVLLLVWCWRWCGAAAGVVLALVLALVLVLLLLV